MTAVFAGRTGSSVRFPVGVLTITMVEVDVEAHIVVEALRHHPRVAGSQVLAIIKVVAVGKLQATWRGRVTQTPAFGSERSSMSSGMHTGRPVKALGCMPTLYGCPWLGAPQFS